MKLFICLLVVLACTVSAQEKPVESARKTLDELTSEIETNKKKIQKKQRERQKALRNLSYLNRELRYTEIKLRRNRKNLQSVKQKSRKTSQELSVLEKTFSKQQENLGRRISDVYKQQRFGLIEFVLAQDDLMGVVESSYYFEQIVKADIDLIQRLNEQYQHLIYQRKKLQRQRQQISALAQQISRQEKSLERKKNQKSSYAKRLKSDIKAIERRNRELEEASQSIAQFIRKKITGGREFYGTGAFVKPVAGWISSRFGSRLHPIFKRWIKHRGMDFAAPRGYKIKATDSGVVIVAGQKREFKGYGKVTVIDHGYSKQHRKRISTLYAHQSRILTKVGDFVQKGQEIGWVGSTGYSTGPHLHFEVRLDGVPVNPERFLRL